MEAIGKVTLFILVVGALALLLAFPTMWLVNYVFTPSIITTLFGASYLEFWKALGLNLLCGILFKSSISNSSKK